MNESPMKVSTWGKGGDLFKACRHSATTLQVGVSRYELFKKTTSDIGVLDTNMEDPGRLPKNIDMKIYRIGVRMSYTGIAAATADVLQRMNNVLDQGYIEFLLSGKQNLGLWPLSYFQAPTSVVLADAANNLAIQGGTSEPAWLSLGQLPINLEGQANFSVLLVTPAITVADIRVDIILDGVEQRQS